MSTPIPIQRPSLESIQSEIQALREQVAQLQPNGSPSMYEFPARISRAVVAPQKYTSTLPCAVMMALRRFSDYRGGEQINVIVSEALRSYIPREHFDAALEELMMEQRRLWSEMASTEERQG